MKPNLIGQASRVAQVYLLQRDAGLLCRILGLYAARGMELLQVDYAYAAQDVMKLSVSVASPEHPAESVRVLVEKAGTFVGVLAAAEEEPQPASRRLSAR